MIIKNDPDTIRSYFEDSSNLKGGHAEKVLIPENIQELSHCLKEADSKKTPVTISGGGTSTTGSRVPFGGIVISMERFNKIIEISEERKVAIVETGVMVEDFKKACEDRKLFYTSHPTEQTASIGGTVATNASGARSFKYGPTRRYVKRLKMVLPNGDIFDLRRGEKHIYKNNPCIKLPGGPEINIPLPGYKMPAVKNAAGYYAQDGMDLIDLFIGQEGTLSVITEIELGLVNMPDRILSAFVFFEREEDAWHFADEARAISKGEPGEDGIKINTLSIEYFDANALRLLRMNNISVPEGARSAIFFEEELASGDADVLSDGWFKLIAKHGISLEDTWVAMNEKDAETFIGFRHSIPEAMNDIIRRNGFQKLSTDIAVPEDHFIEMMDFYSDRLNPSGIDYCIFGHIGECHLHVNLLPKSEEELASARETYMEFIKKGVALGGTVSAEHGIGKIKHRYLEVMYGKEGVLEMARLKKSIDRNCILGLDNIFSKELLREI